jgi:hypothetical protein
MQISHHRGGARLSACGRYRYSLWRSWDARLPSLVWCLLNPSTADAEREDATTRRLRAFSRAWGCGGYVLVNLFALRATDPAELRKAADPVGPENDAAIRRATAGRRGVVIGWGTHGGCRGRDIAVLNLLARVGAMVECLGTTKDGCPRHPLRLARATRLAPLCKAPSPERVGGLMISGRTAT